MKKVFIFILLLIFSVVGFSVNADSDIENRPQRITRNNTELRIQWYQENNYLVLNGFVKNNSIRKVVGFRTIITYEDTDGNIKHVEITGPKDRASISPKDTVEWTHKIKQDMSTDIVDAWISDFTVDNKVVVYRSSIYLLILLGLIVIISSVT